MDGPAGSSHSNGFGDIRGAVRVSPELFSIYDLPVAVRAGFKVSGSEFPVDATEIPLSEGQRDIDLSVESGWSSLEHPIYAVGWIGYRWRAENEKVEYEPDNEIFAHAAVGGTLAAFHLELGVDALWGADLVELGDRAAEREAATGPASSDDWNRGRGRQPGGYRADLSVGAESARVEGCESRVSDRVG